MTEEQIYNIAFSIIQEVVEEDHILDNEEEREKTDIIKQKIKEAKVQFKMTDEEYGDLSEQTAELLKQIITEKYKSSVNY